MIVRRLLVTVALTALAGSVASAALPAPPAARRTPVTDTYFGKTVVDPYRWMEANPKTSEFIDYLKAQDARTRAALDALPGRAKLAARLTELSNASAPAGGVAPVHGRYFYERTPVGTNSVKLFVRDGARPERVLVDPDAMSGPRVAISGFVPSDDGALVAVQLSPGGSENAHIHVIDVASGKMLADDVDRSDFGISSWTDDGKGFYYLRRPQLAPGDAPTLKYQNIRAYVHLVGTDAATDVAVAGPGLDPALPVAPTIFPAVAVSPDSPYAVAVLINGVDRFRTVYVAPKAALASPATIPWRRVVTPSDQVNDIAVHGSTAYALTASGAKRFRVVAFDLAAGSFATNTSVIPASDRVIDTIATASDALYVAAREDGLGRVVRVPYPAPKPARGPAPVVQPVDIPVPVNGTISGLATEYDRPGFVAQFESWTSSPLWYRYDPLTSKLADIGLSARSPVDYSDIVSEEVKVPARDGTLVPLSIVHRREMVKDRSNPTLLYAYGSYGISSSPGFSASRLAFLERGGVYAVAHVRGGGEYGEEWHLAGKGPNKSRTIDDFVDCGQWLVAQQYTSPAKLGARGGSAGGITMGGAIERAPGLFAAVLDEIPVSDQLRIEFTSNGPPNIPEFGSVTTKSGFDDLYATSAFQHITPGTAYPAVMLTTGINDPRVDSWQAAKMAAGLATATTSTRPILLRVDFDGGHGLIGAGRRQAIALAADEYAFLFWQFGDPAFKLQ